MNGRIRLVLASAILALSPAAVAAQGPPPGKGNTGLVLTDTWSVTVDRQLYISVSNPTITFPMPDALAFGSGFVLQGSTASSVTHRSNVSHSILVEAASGTFPVSGPSANPGKPSTDLEFRVDGGAWQSMPFGSANPVHAAGFMGAHDNHDLVEFRILLGYADDGPGTYTLDVLFTIVAN